MSAKDDIVILDYAIPPIKTFTKEQRESFARLSAQIKDSSIAIPKVELPRMPVITPPTADLKSVYPGSATEIQWLGDMAQPRYSGNAKQRRKARRAVKRMTKGKLLFTQDLHYADPKITNKRIDDTFACADFSDLGDSTYLHLARDMIDKMLSEVEDKYWARNPWPVPKHTYTVAPEEVQKVLQEACFDGGVRHFLDHVAREDIESELEAYKAQSKWPRPSVGQSFYTGEIK